MINILEILKKIPNLEDMVFYSPIYGDVKVNIVNQPDYMIKINSIKYCRATGCNLTKNGLYDLNMNGECLLYPSRKNRDWSKFKIPRKDLLEGTSVLVAYQKGLWYLGKYLSNGNIIFDNATKTYNNFKYIIPVNKFDFNNWSFKEEDNYGTEYKE